MGIAMKYRFADRPAILIAIMVTVFLFVRAGQASGAESLTFGLLDTDSKPYKWKEYGRYIGYFTANTCI
ncbi:MAG TPA: hypothetical protein DCE18_08490 [Syntrophobacteraceae bacterium]|nr:hypothetical protein [Syntrophobacteraceae bacterium]